MGVRALFALAMFCWMWLAVAAAAQAENTADQDYQLGAGDVLEISVWGEEDLRREVQVRPDGKISFPLLGDVQAAGRSVSELKQEMESRMQTYVPDAPITVILVKLGHPRIYVVGKVEQPGPFMMDSQLSVIQALSMAGGLTKFAKKGDIRVLRGQGQKQQVLKFDYGDLEHGQNLEQNVQLQPGDTIVVP